MNLERQRRSTLVIARIAALSAKGLVYFLQAVLNAAISFQVLHMTPPKYMLQWAVTTVRRAWATNGRPPASLPAEVRAASASYYGDRTDHLVHSAYIAHTTPHLHRLMHNGEPEVQEVFTLTL